LGEIEGGMQKRSSYMRRLTHDRLRWKIVPCICKKNLASNIRGWARFTVEDAPFCFAVWWDPLWALSRRLILPLPEVLHIQAKRNFIFLLTREGSAWYNKDNAERKKAKETGSFKILKMFE